MSPTTPSTPLATVLGVWRPHLPRLLAGAAVSLLAFVSGLALLGTSGLRLAGTGAGLLLASMLLLRLLGAGRIGLRYAERLLTHDAMFRALADLRVWFFRRLAADAGGGIGFRRSGDLLSRLVADVEALDGLYLRILLPFLSAILAVPVILVVAGRWNGALAVGLLVVFVLSAFALPALAAMFAARDAALLSDRAAALRVSVMDLVTGLREIRAFDAALPTRRGVSEREDALLSVQLAVSRRAAAAAAASLLCRQLAVLLLLLALAGIAFHTLPPIPGISLLFVLLAAFEVTGGLSRAGSLVGHVAAAARRVVETGAVTSPAAPIATPAAVPSGHALRIRNLGFRWTPNDPPVLDDLSLDIPAGAHVAILGPSGAGKSTLVSLLLRVLEPDFGHITLGGVPLPDLDPATCRARIGWLGQDTHLFADTVRSNLLLGRPDAAEAELWRVLDQAQLSDVVRALPAGLDTWLGEGGAGLSGGQSRRLALARALLSAAPILVLDEPAAGLDADTELELLRTLNDVGGDRTVILIVHRLTGVERLDRVWHLSAGRATAATA